jgi:hypothetical protein
VQSRQGGGGFYIKSDKGWKFVKKPQHLRDKIGEILKSRDEELAVIAADKESNEEDGEALKELLRTISDRHGKDTWTVGDTRVTFKPARNRFVITHKSRKASSPLKPMMAVDKIVNFGIAKFKKKIVEGIDHKKLKKAVIRCLTRRDERKEAALEVVQVLENITKGHRKDYRYDRSWYVDSTRVVFDKENYKFLVGGEWMLPLQALDKIGMLVPAAAKKLADPRVWGKDD